MKPKVYIDGQSGTTGLQIRQRLSQRSDIELLLIEEEKRRDVEARRQRMNEADLVFLCLPDAAAIEAVELIEDPEHQDHRRLYGHTAVRMRGAYGFVELGDAFLQGVRTNPRIANPGCHATGFISIVYPLIHQGILTKDATITAYSLTGYSGGGKQMIRRYEAGGDPLLKAPQLYALGLTHKHLPEMKQICGLKKDPLFCPVVDDYYSGMATSIPAGSGHGSGACGTGRLLR